jgi:hypothetical protein
VGHNAQAGFRFFGSFVFRLEIWMPVGLFQTFESRVGLYSVGRLAGLVQPKHTAAWKPPGAAFAFSIRYMVLFSKFDPTASTAVQARHEKYRAVEGDHFAGIRR